MSEPDPIDCSEWDLVHLNAPPDKISEAEFLAKDGTYRELVGLEIVKVTRELKTLPGGKKELADLVYFKGKTKALFANKTNKRRIGRQHGKKVRDWYGKKITLFFDTDERYRDPVTNEMMRGSVRVKE